MVGAGVGEGPEVGEAPGGGVTDDEDELEDEELLQEHVDPDHTLFPVHIPEATQPASARISHMVVAVPSVHT